MLCSFWASGITVYCVRGFTLRLASGKGNILWVPAYIQINLGKIVNFQDLCTRGIQTSYWGTIFWRFGGTLPPPIFSEVVSVWPSTCLWAPTELQQVTAPEETNPQSHMWEPHNTWAFVLMFKHVIHDEACYPSRWVHCILFNWPNPSGRTMALMFT
jgi:hypothetical protein